MLQASDVHMILTAGHLVPLMRAAASCVKLPPRAIAAERRAVCMAFVAQRTVTVYARRESEKRGTCGKPLQGEFVFRGI